MFARLVTGAVLMLAAPAAAQDPVFFRIGTGATAGTYYPVGVLVATAISAPPGTDCAGGCGVAGLVAAAVATGGSVDNILGIQAGSLESGFVQGDVAAWAHDGTGIWAGKPAAGALRAIASLYPESVHLVVAADAGIASVADLRGRRVSLAEANSGTLVEAQIILNAAGLDEADLVPEYLRLDQAAERMRAGDLDAFFFVGGWPAGAIAELASQFPVTLLPIDGDTGERVRASGRFFAADIIPAGTYAGVGADVATVSVGAQWLTSADQPEALIHDITAALWSERTGGLLGSGHPRGAMIARDTALNGLAVPLHPGAERFYRDAGMIAPCGDCRDD